MNCISINADAAYNGKRFSPQTQGEILLQPYTHLTQVPLPEVWKKLGKAFNVWLNVPENDLKEMENIIETTQYYNTLLNDIEENRDSRGAIPSAHSAYGIAHTITAYLYALVGCIRKVHVLNRKLNKPHEELLKKTSLARCMELLWKYTVSCPTEEEYFDMIIQKSYALLTTKIKFMQTSSSSIEDFTKLSGMFGLYFQILDDYQRFKSNDESCQSYLEDITLGRFSLPIIHAIKTQPKEGTVVLDILRTRTKDKDLKKYVVTLIQRAGSFEYTKKVLAQLQQEILREVNKFNKNSLIEKLMEEHFDSSVDTIQPSHRISANTNSIFLYIAQMESPKSQNTLNFQIEQVLKPLSHLDSVPGKNIRVGFTRVLNKWLNASEKEVAVIEHVIDYLHEASLLVDDIQDGSVLRRGIPVAHHIYGIGNTINAATYMIAVTIENILSLQDPKAMDIYVGLSESIVRGQGMDIYWRDSCVCPSEAEYLEMVLGKSATPFVLIGKLLALFSTASKSPVRLVSTVGQFFQINDDYQNLTNQVFFDSKGFCEDLTEGKFGFPVVHAINSHPKEGQIIMDILRKRTYDVETKKFCLSLIEKCGSFGYTKSKLKELREIIAEEITGYGESISVLEFLEKQMFIPNI